MFLRPDYIKEDMTMADDVDIASNAIDAAMEDTLALRRASAEADMAARRNIENQNVTRECCECGEDIPRPRLIAAPRTKRCAPCQEEFETRAR